MDPVFRTLAKKLLKNHVSRGVRSNVESVLSNNVKCVFSNSPTPNNMVLFSFSIDPTINYSNQTTITFFLQKCRVIDDAPI